MDIWIILFQEGNKVCYYSKIIFKVAIGHFLVIQIIKKYKNYLIRNEEHIKLANIQIHKIKYIKKNTTY